MSDHVEIPAEEMAEHVRQQALLDSDPRVLAPEGAEVDVWDTIEEADVTDVRWEDGDLHWWAETETRLQERVATATRHQPAEYRNHYCTTYVSMVWSFDPEESPAVDIEVESP